MIEKVKINKPTYYDEFKCIGGKCTDSCCIGWDIDIDKETFRKYYKVKDDNMKKLFQKNLYNNEYSDNPNIDYALVKLKENKRCAFLDNCNLCTIQLNLGEEYLSNVCSSFPRITNLYNGIYETSLDVACIEAARIVLLKKEGIKFQDDMGALGKHIISANINSKSKEFKKSPLRFFTEIRTTCINILQNRKLSLQNRMYALGDFLYNIDEDINYLKDFNIEKCNILNENNKSRYIIQKDFYKKMLEFLDVSNEVDSKSFKNYTEKLINGLNLEKDSKEFIEKFIEYEENYFNKYSYIFENYLVNYIYNYCFPFSETELIFDGYIMLLARYSFIRFYLVGNFITNKVEDENNIVEFIQSFSKTVEHHKTYLMDSLHYIKENEFDNMEFVKILL